MEVLLQFKVAGGFMDAAGAVVFCVTLVLAVAVQPFAVAVTVKLYVPPRVMFGLLLVEVNPEGLVQL